MGWWHRCFVLSQRSKADQHQFLCSPLAWAFSVSCSVTCSTTPGLGQGPSVTQEPHRQAESRGLGWGASFSKSQTAATAAGVAKKSKEKKEASVCPSSSDAELVSLPGSVWLWERQMLPDWCLAPRKSILQKRESRSCHCSRAAPLSSQKETTEGFRTGVSGSWELQRLSQGSSHCSASRKAALGELAASALALDLRLGLEITGRTGTCRVTPSLHIPPGYPTFLTLAAPAPSPLWSLGAIKSFTKIPCTPAIFCHLSTILGPVHARLTLIIPHRAFIQRILPDFFLLILNLSEQVIPLQPGTQCLSSLGESHCQSCIMFAVSFLAEECRWINNSFVFLLS